MSADPELAFVDANILVYAFDASAGDRHARAQRLIEGLWNDGSGCLSVQVLQEFFVTVTKKVPKPLTIAEAETSVRCPPRFPPARPPPMTSTRMASA